MPKYLLQIIETEDAYVGGDETLFANVMEMHNDFSKAVADAGASLLGGEALRPTPTATYLRHTRTPDVTVVDNPAPDLKEVLGGYYLIEAADDAQARKLAKVCPAPFGYIEVRPIWEFDA